MVYSWHILFKLQPNIQNVMHLYCVKCTSVCKVFCQNILEMNKCKQVLIENPYFETVQFLCQKCICTLYKPFYWLAKVKVTLIIENSFWFGD